MERVLRLFQHGILAEYMPAYYSMQAVNGDRVPESSFRPDHGGLSFIYDAKLRAFHQSFQIISGVFRDIPFWFRSFPRQGRGSSLKWQ